MELKKIIQQDVIRTSPGVEFFRTEKIQKIMVDLLFCYSREHPDLSYRQVCPFKVHFCSLLLLFIS
jgi:TBC1 domain family protein 5